MLVADGQSGRDVEGARSVRESTDATRVNVYRGVCGLSIRCAGTGRTSEASLFLPRLTVKDGGQKSGKVQAAKNYPTVSTPPPYEQYAVVTTYSGYTVIDSCDPTETVFDVLTDAHLIDAPPRFGFGFVR